MYFVSQNGFLIAVLVGALIGLLLSRIVYGVKASMRLGVLAGIILLATMMLSKSATMATFTIPGIAGLTSLLVVFLFCKALRN